MDLKKAKKALGRWATKIKRALQRNPSPPPPARRGEAKPLPLVDLPKSCAEDEEDEGRMMRLRRRRCMHG
ncbi:hypothetical protein Tdes44962_MAKER01294 [Teratosphaeria destructans]|uniref:Uncharacterized protein n=1 Tax=Teratosphaeria destructans TaxID=418781 RepID=A0A9W7W6P3_9PEZI|nr:hypothetical protein Tdes44962_MAKER01294 [Teratosphaeria destructans]